MRSEARSSWAWSARGRLWADHLAAASKYGGDLLVQGTVIGAGDETELRLVGHVDGLGGERLWQRKTRPPSRLVGSCWQWVPLGVATGGPFRRGSGSWLVEWQTLCLGFDLPDRPVNPDFDAFGLALFAGRSFHFLDPLVQEGHGESALDGVAPIARWGVMRAVFSANGYCKSESCVPQSSWARSTKVSVAAMISCLNLSFSRSSM